MTIRNWYPFCVVLTRDLSLFLQVQHALMDPFSVLFKSFFVPSWFHLILKISPHPLVTGCLEKGNKTNHWWTLNLLTPLWACKLNMDYQAFAYLNTSTYVAIRLLAVVWMRQHVNLCRINSKVRSIVIKPYHLQNNLIGSDFYWHPSEWT